MDHIDRPLTTRQVAAIFGVSITTVKRWSDAGQIPHFRTLGGHYRYSAADIEAARLRPPTSIPA